MVIIFVYFNHDSHSSGHDDIEKSNDNVDNRCDTIKNDVDGAGQEGHHDDDGSVAHVNIFYLPLLWGRGRTIRGLHKRKDSLLFDLLSI